MKIIGVKLLEPEENPISGQTRAIQILYEDGGMSVSRSEDSILIALGYILDRLDKLERSL